MTTAYALEVQPSRLELTVSEGEPLTGQLRIDNPSGNPVEVRVGAGPYRFPDPDNKLPSCQDWFKFEPETLTLAGGASTTVNYTVTPPANLDVDTAGEYLAAILVDQLPPKTEKEAGKARLTVVPRLALAVYVIIEGRDRVEVELGGLKAEKLESDEFSRGTRESQPDILKLDVRLKNTGTVHVRPSGTYALFREGTLHHTAPLGKGMPLLPGAEMTVPALLPLPPTGAYRWVVTLDVKDGSVLQEEASFAITEEGELLMGSAA